MTKNLGQIDRVIRTIVGLVFIYLGFIDNQVVTDELSSNVLGVLGVVFLSVVAVGSCPLYSVIGINTCGKK